MFGREPWPAQRVVLILPLKLGAGWNLDKEKSARILPEAEQKLQQALQRTGKFSTTQVHRYNPILLRGMLEKLLTKAEVDAIVAAPTLENVQGALGKMRFDQPPLIADFTLEEITTENGSPIPSVRSQAIGKLFEANDPVAIKTISVTSEPQPLYYPRKGKKNVYVKRSSYERVVTAADNAFNQIAQEFVKPIDEIMLPEPVAPVLDGTTGTGTGVGTGTITPAPPAPTRPGPDGRPVIVVPEGQVLGTFPAPKK